MANTPQEKIQAAWSDAHYSAHDQRVFCWLYKTAQSPIEKIMGQALSIIHTQALEAFNDLDTITNLVGHDEPNSKWLFMITPQMQYGQYRVDFSVECKLCPEKVLIVECDGHDFHEKTKEQAAKDKSRDRALTLTGLSIMRFTGSEIYTNPCGCLADVIAYFYQYVDIEEMHDFAQNFWDDYYHG